MISSARLAPLGVMLLGASSALAFEKISIQSVVEADTEVEVKIRNDIADGDDSFDAGFTNYNVYLATTPPGWGTGPVCLLANGTKIDETTVKVKIPADIAPDGTELSITTMEWNSDPYEDGPSGYQYSNTFTLEGGTGKWSKTDLQGSGVGDMDKIPCSAYACAAKCSDKYLEVYQNLTVEDMDDIEIFKPQYDCLAACKGTTFPSWDSVVKEWEEYEDSLDDDDGDDGEDDDENSTSTKSASHSTATDEPSSSTVVSSVASSATTLTQAASSSTAAAEGSSSTAASTAASTVSTTQESSSPSETSNGVGRASVQAAGALFISLAAALSLL